MSPCVPYEYTGKDKVGFWSDTQWVDTVNDVRSPFFLSQQFGIALSVRKKNRKARISERGKEHQLTVTHRSHTTASKSTPQSPSSTTAQHPNPAKTAK
jgi:hypothetical protein